MNTTSSTVMKVIIGILAVIGALALLSVLFMALMHTGMMSGMGSGMMRMMAMCGGAASG